jgi:recombination protein RecT
MNTTTQVTTAKQPKCLKDIINSDAMRNQFAMALPKHLTADRFARVAITALTRTPKLQECTQESFMRCLLDLSAMGLEPDGRRAHLIPYGKDCTLVIDYKGIVELVMRSGMVSRIHADKVCDADEFEYDCGDVKLHRINFRQPRDPAYAYYALVKFKDGTEKSEVMSLDEIEAIRNRSQGYKSAIQYNKSHPWLTDFDEMAKKTVFRRCSKWLQLSPEIRDALEHGDEIQDEQPRRATGRVIPEAALPMPRVNPYAAPEPEPTPAESPEPIAESPVEVSEATGRAQLIDSIKHCLMENDSTVAKFAPLCRTAGLLADKVQLIDAQIESLRIIESNSLAILKGEWKL